MSGHGFHWSRCRGGGGPDLTGLIEIGALIGVVAGVALAILEFAWLVVTVLLVLAAIVAAAWIWFRHRDAVGSANIAARFERERQLAKAEAADAVAAQRRHELDVAAASAPQISITNTIDPAAILAAFANLRQPPQPQPVRVIRSEVER